MRTLAFALVLALALSLSGCVQNARDLTDKLGTGSGESTELTQASTTSNVSANVTRPPPVARIAIFGLNGALLYKASFVAEDVLSAPVVIEAGVNLTLVASDSEAFGGAKLTYAWDLAGAAASGPKANASFTEPGKYAIKLTATDSNGLSDTQTVALVIPPMPFDVYKNVTTTQVVGVLGAGESGAATFEVALADAEVPATLQNVKVRVVGRDACDVVLSVADKDAKTVGASDKGGLGSTEETDLGPVPEGKYTVSITSGDPCVEPDGVPVIVMLTFLPVIDGLAADEHGGHAH